MVRAANLEATLVYTYTSATLSASTADGLRVQQVAHAPVREVVLGSQSG